LCLPFSKGSVDKHTDEWTSCIKNGWIDCWMNKRLAKSCSFYIP
jgi:hypothetical protein